MREIPLTQGEVALVDDEDFEFLNSFKWNVKTTKGVVNKYACRLIRPEPGGKQKAVIMHRLIMNPEKGLEIDHIDGNGLNNQKSNLRKCTALENQRNRRKIKSLTSGFKGVWFEHRGGCWRSAIRINGRLKHLGSFRAEIDAASAYNKAAIQFFGQFARINETCRRVGL